MGVRLGSPIRLLAASCGFLALQIRRAKMMSSRRSPGRLIELNWLVGIYPNNHENRWGRKGWQDILKSLLKGPIRVVNDTET